MGFVEKQEEKVAKEDWRAVALPIELCEPHPDLHSRLEYHQIDRLAEDIRVNGQLQPGRAVEKQDGTGYFVYIGRNRLFAVRRLFEKYGQPTSYLTILDDRLPFVELFSRSMSENLRSKNLSVLDEMRSYDLASKLAGEKEILQASCRIGESAEEVKRMISLAGVFGDKLKRLYDIEVKTGFSFQLGHLEAFAEASDERKLYEMAAVAAVSRFTAREVKASLRASTLSGLVDGLAPWFSELFPEYGSTTTASGRKLRRTHKLDGGGSPPAGVPYKENLPFVECPHCGAQNPFELKERSTVTLYKFDRAAVPKKDSVTPEGVYGRSGNCANKKCGKEFWLVVSSIDGQVQIETKGTMDWKGGFGMPSGRPRIGSVSWDNVRQTWLVKEKCEAGTEKVYLYQEDGKFTEA
ncbi:MAG: hypothetical protein JRN72_04560 [Nitrososphaerota archaeon]|jgi:hypothetical protein|nr:hypothetical protein [Nitrososphaerota archaeon]MDG6949363.1 hypothetical protein [Nitrososphaerota archaeon]